MDSIKLEEFKLSVWHRVKEKWHKAFQMLAKN